MTLKTSSLFRYARDRLRSNPISSTVLFGVSASGVRAAVSLITVPVLIGYLGVGGYGFWLIALSLMGMMSVVNQGMSSAIITAIGRLNIDEERDEESFLASTSMVLSFGLGILFALVALPLVTLIDWGNLFSVPEALSDQDVALFMAVLCCAVSGGFVSAVPKSVLNGLMKGYVVHNIDIISVLISAGLLYLFVWLDYPIHVLGAVFLFPPIIVGLVAASYFAYRNHVYVWKFQLFNQQYARNILSEGGKLTLNQLSFSLAAQTDLLLIGLISGASAGAVYGVAHRLYGLLLLFINILTSSLWPALCKADSEGRSRWVRSTYLITLYGSFLFMLIAVVFLTYFFDDIVVFWIGDVLTIDALLAYGMACWVLVTVIESTNAMLLKALNRTSLLAGLTFMMMLLNVPISVFLIFQIGAAGAIWGTVLSYFICLNLPYIFIYPTLFSGRFNVR